MTSPATEIPTEPETETATAETESETTDMRNIIPAYPENNGTVKLINEAVWSLCDGYTLGKTNKLSPLRGLDEYFPEIITLSFTCRQEVDYYRISLSRKADLSDSETFLTGEPELVLDHLFNGVTYYWQVDAVASDKTYRSEVFSFSTVNGPRTIRNNLLEEVD